MRIPITDDSVLENSETFNIVISTTDEETLLPSPEATVTILDDDMIGISLEESSYEISEGDGVVEICVVVASGVSQRMFEASVMTADISTGKKELITRLRVYS